MLTSQVLNYIERKGEDSNETLVRNGDLANSRMLNGRSDTDRRKKQFAPPKPCETHRVNFLALIREAATG